MFVGVGRVQNARHLHHPIQHLPVVHLHHIVATFDAHGFQRITQHHANLGVGGDTCRPHRIGIALIKLPKPPRPGFFVAPDRPHGVAPVRRGQFVAILRRHPRQGGGQIVAQGKPVGLATFTSGFLPAEDPLVRAVDIGQELAQHLKGFHRRGLQGIKAVAMVNFGDRLQHGLTLAHFGTKIVAKPFGGFGARTADFTCRHGTCPLHLMAFPLPVEERLGKQGMDEMDRLDAMEERTAHLIRAVEDLSDIVARQGREIDTLTRRVHMLMEREAEREAGMADTPAADVKPPHW